MKVNKKKANQIMGLYAILNKIELGIASQKLKESTSSFGSADYQDFVCSVYFCEIYKSFFVRLHLSQYA